MQLRTPKRYTPKGSRRPLLNLRWLWLYILIPIILIPLVLIWAFRAPISDSVGQWIGHVINISKPVPTITPAPTFTGDPVAMVKSDFGTGRVNNAITLLKSLTDFAPNQIGFPSLAVQFLVLRSYSTDQSKLDDAASMAQKAINADPEAADGWLAEAMVLDYSGKPQEALAYALRAKDFTPKAPMLTAILAELYHAPKKDDQAEKLVDSAIAAAKAAQPVDKAALAHAYYVKAVILETTSPYGTDAISEMENAWKVAISDPPEASIIPSGYIAQYLGAAYLNLGKTDLAINVLSEAIQRDQEDPIVQWQLGRVYMNIGDPNKARAYIETCRDLDPTHPKCLRSLAALYFSEQNYQQAAETIQIVIDQNSQKPGDYLTGGLAYSYLNQCTTAIGILQRGLPFIDPTDTKTKADFDSAFQACGAASGLDIAATAAATDHAPAPTITPSPTKKK